MRTTTAVLALCTVVACEMEAPSPAALEPPHPGIALAPQPVLPVPDHEHDPVPVIPPGPPPAPPPLPVVPHRHGPLPTPPSVEPTVYKKWLHGLPDEDRQAVDRFCKKHRQDYQETCGGIGPLHIPYPPYMRVSIRPPHTS